MGSMKRAGWAGLLLMVALAAGCRTKDIRTMILYVPEMKNVACSDVVVRAISRCQGVLPNSVNVDLDRRTVTVEYDSIQTAFKNIEFAVAEAGFRANLIPAKPEAVAALPENCR